VRIYNNIFVKSADLTAYDTAPLPVWMDGNVFLQGAKPGVHEKGAIVDASFDPGLGLTEDNGVSMLSFTVEKKWAEQNHRLVTTELLGTAAIPRARFEKPDGKPIWIKTDYFGAKRDARNPFPGPFEFPEGGKRMISIWPLGTAAGK
jgi:alpha-N-arabinofuranosidase